VSDIEFELIVGEAGGEIHNADIPVRWCVTPSMVKNMEDAGIVDPHVLLLTATKDGTEIQRQVIPITELMTYARYVKSGNMKLYGWIVDGKMGRKKLHQTLTRMVHGRYNTTLIDWDGNSYADIENISYAHVAMDIEIPDGVFGKEPNAWVKWFSNLWHEARTVDQCHFRRRMILAFTLKWIPVLAFVIVSSGFRLLVAAFLCLIGYHKWVANPKYIFRPFDAEFNNVFELEPSVKNIFLFTRKTKYKKWNSDDVTQSHITGFSFMPFIPLLIFSLLLLTKTASEALVGTGYIMATILTVAVTFDILVAGVIWFQYTTLFSALRTRLHSAWKTFDTYLTKTNGWKKMKVAGIVAIVALAIAFAINNTTLFLLFGKLLLIIVAVMVPLVLLGMGSMWLMNRFMFGDLEGADYTEIRELLCPKDEENKIASYSAIPKKQRSLRLWYLDTKNKVCKPMQL